MTCVTVLPSRPTVPMPLTRSRTVEQLSAALELGR